MSKFFIQMTTEKKNIPIFKKYWIQNFIFVTKTEYQKYDQDQNMPITKKI